MRIGHSKSAAATPAFALIAEGWNELVQEGLTPDLRADWQSGANSQVLYADRDEDREIVGVLCFVVDDATQHLTVTMAYVEPTSRRQGVYRELWAALLHRAAELKAARVTLAVHVDNVVMHEVMKRLGQPVVGLTYETLVGA